MRFDWRKVVRQEYAKPFDWIVAIASVILLLFLAVGAYGIGIAVTEFGWSLWPSMLVAIGTVHATCFPAFSASIVIQA